MEGPVRKPLSRGPGELPRPGPPATSVAMLAPNDIETAIAEALPGADIEVVDTRGTGDHFQVRVVYEGFEGKTMVEQHQMVYAPLRSLLDSGALHALALRTFTPSQWKAQTGAEG